MSSKDEYSNMESKASDATIPPEFIVTKSLSDAKRQKIYETFNNTIDNVLKALDEEDWL